MPRVSSDVDGPSTVVTARHTDRVLDVLTLGFAAYPPTRWLFPEWDEYARQFSGPEGISDPERPVIVLGRR